MICRAGAVAGQSSVLVSAAGDGEDRAANAGVDRSAEEGTEGTESSPSRRGALALGGERRSPRRRALGAALFSGLRWSGLLLLGLLRVDSAAATEPPAPDEAEPVSAAVLGDAREVTSVTRSDLTRISLAAAEQHWSFRPIADAAPPALGDQLWPKNEIDRFVLEALRARDLEPSPPAPRLSLLKRVHLDLTGLLPTPNQIQAFSSSADLDQAYEEVVDELLASPHFGERWAGHWLDVARYADSDGYAHDEPRVVWPYRDYVIDAFNSDLPFDQFVLEQLAGDLFDDASSRELTAAAFHRHTMTNTEGGIDEEEFRVEALKDRVNTTAKVFLGVTLECAQCHHHPYDPFSQEDYYRLYAFFNDADEAPQLVSTERGDVELPSFAPLLEPRASFVQLRGDFRSAGPEVEPGVPSVLPGLKPEGRASRIDLALWLTSERQPLTARVTVNRIWQRLFGLGLVASEDDFGLRGDAPSHPQLLDWMAHRFMQDWSVKGLIRTIVTSATYRQSSHARSELDDPDNRWLVRQRRLRVEAEIVRDLTLQAAGTLDLTLGGPSVYPPIPAGVLDGGRGAVAWPTSKGKDRQRRGVYTFLYRTVPYPSLFVFDAPEGTQSTTRRARSNTALQALTLLNERVFFEAARDFGRSLAEGDPRSELGLDAALGESLDDARLELAFLRSLARFPSEQERSLSFELLDAERRRPPSESRALWANAESPPTDLVEASAWSLVARVLLNLDEMITRE